MHNFSNAVYVIRLCEICCRYSTTCQAACTAQRVYEYEALHGALTDITWMTATAQQGL